MLYVYTMKNQILFFFLFFQISLFAQKRDVQVYREFVDGKTIVYADNSEFCPVSVVIRTELVNMKSSLKKAFVLVPAQTKKFVVTELTVIDKTKKVSFKYQSSFFLGGQNKSADGIV